MKTSLKLALGSILAATILIDFGSIATAAQIRTVGMVAIIYHGGNISSLSSSIAIGKNTAAGTASIVGNEAATSAVGGAGILTVTNPNTANVSYSFVPESSISLGTSSTNLGRSQSVTIDSNSPQAITVIP
jgi:hypothetical protein